MQCWLILDGHAAMDDDARACQALQAELLRLRGGGLWLSDYVRLTSNLTMEAFKCM